MAAQVIFISGNDHMTDEEIVRLASEYKRNQRQIEQLQKQNERIKELLMEEIAERGGHPLLAGEYKVSESKYKRETIDSKAIKEEFPSVWNAFVKVTEIKRLVIK